MRTLRQSISLIALTILAAVWLTGCPQPPGSGEKTKVEPTTLNFGTDLTELEFEISNDGSFLSVLQWTITPQQDWITCDPTSGQSGTLGFGNQTVTVTIDRNALSPGQNTGIILAGNEDPNGEEDFGGIVAITVLADGGEGPEGEGEGAAEGEGEGAAEGEGEGAAEGEGEGEGAVEGEGEGEEVVCPAECTAECSSGGISGGVANALAAIYVLPTVGQDPQVADGDENGIIDLAQMQLLDLILANPSVVTHCCILAAWQTNFALIDDALDTVESTVFETIPRDTLQAAFTGITTIGEPSMLDALDIILAVFGVNIDYTLFDLSSAQYLASDGDADMDGVCNLAEYNASVSSAADFFNFTLRAVDPSFRDNGGGCFEPCYEEVLIPEGEGEGIAEGEGEGIAEGEGEGVAEGEGEGVVEGEGEGLAEGEGEGGTPVILHSADYNNDGTVVLSELLRVIQLYNSNAFSCASDTEDGFALGTGKQDCTPHSSDYNPQDWKINLSELLRLVQFFNFPTAHYYACGAPAEDGFCLGSED